MGATLHKPQRAGNGRRRRRTQPMAEINVTPFVDVMLVLLIIFMVAAPMLTVGVQTELPKTAAGALPVDQEEPLTITITADLQVHIQNSAVDRARLVPQLRAIAAERDSDRVFVRADGSVPHAEVMQIMGALSAGGFRHVGLVTDIGGPTLGAPGTGG
jgi:biopolymer transport protein TolR